MYTSESIAESDYEGWVAWTDEGPLFESVPFLPGLAPVASVLKGGVPDYRGAGRNTMDWAQVPGAKVNRFELYFSRETYPGQPAFRADREPGSINTRFIQMKMGGIVLNTGGSDPGQRRLGLVGYKVGIWVPERHDCRLWEFTRKGWSFLGKRKSPMLHIPIGFGLSRETMGAET